MAMNNYVMTYLITGGSGSMGRQLAKHYLSNPNTEKVIVYSRDEYKHALFREEVPDKRLRFIIGDIRDLDRITRAVQGVDYVIHAAALKRVPEGQYNPSEFVKTNVVGTENVITACALGDVKRAVFLSTDKACEPINHYGKTKAVAEELWLQANIEYRPIFNVTRYGNVINSTGSVVPLFRRLVEEGATSLPVTSPDMTRFAMSFDDAVRLVDYALYWHLPQIIFVAEAPTFSMRQLCEAFRCDMDIIGVRPGEKMHEVLIHSHESPRAYYADDHYQIIPEMPYDDELDFTSDWLPFGSDLEYQSFTNTHWLTVSELKEMI